MDTARVTEAVRLAMRSASDVSAYVVVDAAADAELAFDFRIRNAPRRSLFLPDMQDALWDVAPYVIAIDAESPFVDRWADAWGASAGVVLTTRVAIDALAAHLRSIFVVKDETGQEYFFRFYDPRVLRSFLPTCTPSQLEEFFGPVETFAVEADGAHSLLQFRRDGVRLVEKRVPLDDAAVPQA